MEKILSKIRTLNILRYVYLGSLIVSSAAFIMLTITSILSATGILDNNPGSMAIVVIDGIIAALRVVVCVSTAVVFIISIKINKGCKNAFIIACSAAVIKLVAFIFELTLSVRYLNQSLQLVADILIVFAMVMLIDSVFEKAQRKTPLFSVFKLGLGMFIASSIFTFIATIAKYGANLNLAFIFTARVLDVVAALLLYVSFKKFFELIENAQQNVAELHGQEA